MKILIAIFRFFLSRRYKVEIKGLDVLNHNGSNLILPNHQALIDPQLLAAHLWKEIEIVPVVTEGMYNIPVLHALFKWMNAVSVSDLSAGSRDTDVLKNITSAISKALKDGRNVLLYPSGQITGQGYEKIFNKKSAHELVLDLPDNTRVIGVRIRGLWGSMWSRAWIGKTPNLVTTYFRAIWYVFANLIFLCPRRKVYIEIEDITDYAKALAAKNRKSFNDGLENFYNKYGEENVHFLKHYVYSPKLKRKLPNHIECSVADMQSNEVDPSTVVPPQIFDDVLKVLSDELSMDFTGATINSNFTLDLGVDSVTMVSIITTVETYFKVQSPDVASIKTLRDLCLVAMGKSSLKIVLKDAHFDKSKIPAKIMSVDGSKTIPELFVKTFTEYKDEVFVWDNMIGSSTRKEFYLKTMVVAEIIRKEVPGTHVGIMLPALQSTALLVAATYMAGKIPVMLNWTVGPKVLQHCVDTSKLTHIITAGAFFDKIRDKLSEDVKAKCIMFEKKVREASVGIKLKGLLRSKIKPSFSVKPDDTAVILFTSGSESLPKAVPLSHKNILRDMEGSFNHLAVGNDSIFLSFLPPFHSFGFSVLTAVPLVTGMKIAYTPDPTATREIVDIIRHTGVNTLLATPTFLKMILAIATPDDLKNIRLAVTGAESLQPSIIDDFKKKTNKDALIVEGYGITECAPAITLNPSNKQKLKSVGTFISTVDHLIVDLQNSEPLEQGKEGMILVRGDNVFSGYLDKTVASPFVTVNGKEYYKTGDLGYVDSDGFLFITGRLKRFIKIAGEMISLPAIEQRLLEKYGSSEDVVLAIEGSDSIEPPQIVLFSKVDIDIAEANLYLRNSGFSNLVKVNRSIKLDEIPLLGTGKTDYKILKGMI